MRGGKREGAGRRPGISQPRAGAALLQAARLNQAKRPRASNGVELTALRNLLIEYSQLAKTAKRAHDAAGYKTWAAAVERVAALLLAHEARQPAAAAPKVTNFTVSIFKDGKPLNIVPAPVDHPKTIDAVAAPAAEPVQPKSPPEPPQPEPLVTADALAKSATLKIASQHNDPLPPPDPPSWSQPRSAFGNPYFVLSSERHGTRHH
jgi:hypothetical protein